MPGKLGGLGGSAGGAGGKGGEGGECGAQMQLYVSVQEPVFALFSM